MAERELALSLVAGMDSGLCFLVSRPHLISILSANSDTEAHLYRESVSVERLQQQHQDLVDILQDRGAKVFDMMDFTSGNQDNLPNAMFTRDPFLSTPKGIVLGRFKDTTRRLETEIAAKVLERLKLPVLGQIVAEGVVEGGDFATASDRVFICVGNRTNMEGALQLMHNDWIGSSILSIVHYPEDGDMRAMHLDCYFGLAGKRHAVVWKHALEVATVSEWRKGRGGEGYRMLRADVPFATYLESCGIDVIPVDDASQERYACNFLDLGNGYILTQERRTTQELMARGYRATFVPFDEAHKMYGGIHCAVQPLPTCPP
jgi:N-dimethylarginine dimethylaminohydrolase